MDIGHILVGLADAVATDAATAMAKETISPPMPPKFTLTQRVLVHMMRENTGASILDSGGTNSRAWQQNLLVDFSQREAGSLETWVHQGKLDMCPTIDLFTYLVSRLDYDRALTRQFRAFAALPENADESHLANMQAFPAWIAEKREVDCEHSWTGNSYNEDNFLSGTVQYTGFDLDGEEYVLLQIHGGADVRGGYTAPQVFKVDDNFSWGDWYNATICPDWKEIKTMQERLTADLDRQTFLFPEVEAQIRAEVSLMGESVHWDVGGNTDGGDGVTHRDIEEYPVLEIEERSQWVKGSVCVLPDHSALCPETGAVLRCSFFY